MSKHLDRLLAQAARLEKAIEKALNRPSEPETTDPDGALVVWFRVKFRDGRVYSYSALRAGARWWLTGNRNNEHMSWDLMIEDIEDRGGEIQDMWIATEWTRHE